MPRKKKETQLDNIEAVKRLLILSLIKQEVGLLAIADALCVDKATVSRMVPQKNINKK